MTEYEQNRIYGYLERIANTLDEAVVQLKKLNDFNDSITADAGLIGESLKMDAVENSPKENVAEKATTVAEAPSPSPKPKTSHERFVEYKANGGTLKWNDWQKMDKGGRVS